MVRAFYSKTPEKILESTFLCPTSSRVRRLNCRGCSLEVLLTANMRRSEHWGSNTFVLFWKVTLCCAAVKSESQAFFPPSLLFFLEALSIFLSAWPLLQQHRLRPHCVTWTMSLECNTKLLLVWMCWKKRENIYIYIWFVSSFDVKEQVHNLDTDLFMFSPCTVSVLQWTLTVSPRLIFRLEVLIN